MRSRHQHRLLDIVRHQQDGGDRHAALAPQVEQVGAQRLGGQHVERRERLVHQQHLGMHHQRAGEPDPLAHAARQLLRIGAFVAVEADQVDGGQRALVAFGRIDAQRLEADLDVLQHGQPGKQREGLEDHGDFGGRARHVAPADRHLAFAGRHQAGDDAQQRGLAAARAAEQRDDLVLAQPQADIVEDQQVLAAALGVELAHMVDFDQRRGGCVHAELLNPDGSGARPGDRAAARSDDCRSRPSPT